MTLARFGRVLAGALCLCGMLMTAGCGGGKGEVSGKVSYKGKPVLGGTVSFAPEKGGVMRSPIEEDGSFKISNIPPGKTKIMVETESFRPLSANVGGRRGGGSGVSADFMKQNIEKMNPQGADPSRAKRYVPIPKDYGDPSKSTLTYDVKSGKQTHDIDLK